MNDIKPNRPLPERLRPATLADIIGQQHLVAKNGFIGKSIEANNPVSLIFWGPPGCGKTTLARIYAESFGARFVQLSAVFSGVADLRKVVEQAKSNQNLGERTLLFVDEIHRFNKAQQDAFLPYVEDGTILLIGATTENPSFELNNALLSRVRVLNLKPLNEDELGQMLTRAEDEIGKLPLTKNARELLINWADGDGRYLLNMVENLIATNVKEELDESTLATLLQRRAPMHDKNGEGHYNLISALHKSVRGSDPDAALYYFARMLNGGEDPLYIARRLIRMAVEDIALADPNAVLQANAALQAYQVLGSPEGELALAQCVIYLALAPKTNAGYTAFNKVMKFARQNAELSPPMRILNAPTKMMGEMGYGSGYIYDHDTPEGFSGQDYFPDEIGRQSFYKPVERGFEREMKKRINYFNKMRKSIETN